MSQIILSEQSTAPSTPSSGKMTAYADTSGILITKDDAARNYGFSFNAAITAQAGGFATDTYLTDSHLQVPVFGLQVRTTFLWRVSASKTGVGTAQPIYIIRMGTTKTTASDAARLTLTGPLQTGIADIGTLYVMATVRAIGASGVIQGSAWWVHRGTAASTTVSGTGFANDTTGHVEGTSGSIDMTTSGGQFIGLSINGGASAVWSPTQVHAEACW